MERTEVAWLIGLSIVTPVGVYAVQHNVPTENPNVLLAQQDPDKIQGLAGSMGPTGSTGSRGSRGILGVQGIYGMRGFPGPTGAFGPVLDPNPSVDTLTVGSGATGGGFTGFTGTSVSSEGSVVTSQLVSFASPDSDTFESNFQLCTPTKDNVKWNICLTGPITNPTNPVDANGADLAINCFANQPGVPQTGMLMYRNSGLVATPGGTLGTSSGSFTLLSPSPTTVSDSNVSANSIILLTIDGSATSISGLAYVTSKTAGNSFTVGGYDDPLDVGTVYNYTILN
jgi:hypothetical protein